MAMAACLALTYVATCSAQTFDAPFYGRPATAPGPAAYSSNTYGTKVPAGVQGIAPRSDFAWVGSAPNSVSEPVIPAAHGERTVIVVFTSQSTPKVPRNTHTWAALVRTVSVFDPTTGQTAPQIVDVANISWMPRSHVIKPFIYVVEPGVNLSLESTFDVVLTDGKERITAWGPLEASPELCNRFLARKAFMESGALGYQCVDALGEAAVRRNGVNCIHAITRGLGYSAVDFLQLYGDDSGAGLAATLVHRGLAKPYSPSDHWIVDALNIRGVRIARRLP
jgi:hypothetical protein